MRRYVSSLSYTLHIITYLDPSIDKDQNNGVIALTRCANRKAGYAACFFLVVMGIFSKFAAALVAIPSPVLGGMTVRISPLPTLPRCPIPNT